MKDKTLNEECLPVVSAKMGCEGNVIDLRFKVLDGRFTDVLQGVVTTMCKLWDLPVANANIVPNIREVIFNGPATVLMADGDKSVAVCGDGDPYSDRVGILVAAMKFYDVTHEEVTGFETALRMLAGLTTEEKDLLSGVLAIAADAERTYAEAKRCAE